MSRHHDSRDRDAHHRRRRDDDTNDDKVGHTRTHDRRHRDDQPQQSHHHQRPSGSDQASRRHPPDQRRDAPPHHDRRRDDAPPSHRPAFVKRERSRSPDTKAKRNRNRYANETADDGTHEWGKPSIKPDPSSRPPGSAAVDDEAAAGPVEKEQPNFGLSGKLTEDTNKVNGIVLKYAEPDEARKPKRRWRLYPFKGDEALATLFIHRQSCYLIGRDRKICDIPVDHPSCSKQHAVLQYRLVGYTRDDGTKGKRVRPYVLDLESANGTYLNNERIASKKYVEVLEKDVIKFGYSSREYVMLHENSRDEEEDDDVVEESEPPARSDGRK